MTTRTTLAGVRAEAIRAIAALIPRSHSEQYRFRARTDGQTYGREIEEAAGADMTRLFEIYAAEHVPGQFGYTTDWWGAGTIAPTYRMEIRLLYPDRPDWIENAADDCDLIAGWLRANPSAVPGCQLRVIEGEPAITAMVDEPWRIYRLSMFALLDVAA